MDKKSHLSNLLHRSEILRDDIEGTNEGVREELSQSLRREADKRVAELKASVDELNLALQDVFTRDIVEAARHRDRHPKKQT